MSPAADEHHVTETTTPDRIVAQCVCGESVDMPNKGLGRAMVAAFKSRHQS